MRLHAWIFVGCTVLLATLPAAAQWKWKDARGQVVISDVPPPREIPERDVLQKPELVTRRPANQPAPAASAAVAESVAKARVDPELEARKKKTEQEQTDKLKAEEDKVAAQRAENCRRARSHMASLDSGIRLSRTNDKGERELMSDEEIEAERVRTRREMEEACKTP